MPRVRGMHPRPLRAPPLGCGPAIHRRLEGNAVQGLEHRGDRDAPTAPDAPIRAQAAARPGSNVPAKATKPAPSPNGPAN
jgi:hypothetical protein